MYPKLTIELHSESEENKTKSIINFYDRNTKHTNPLREQLLKKALTNTLSESDEQVFYIFGHLYFYRNLFF